MKFVWRFVWGMFAFTALTMDAALAQTSSGQTITKASALRSVPRDSIMTRAGVCRIWELAPVNAMYPDDASYNACALDVKPRVITRTTMPYTTTPGQWMHAQFIVVVEPDGHVNNKLTRFHMNDSPPGFLEAIRDSLLLWKFSPGIRAGRAVRSALKINLTTIGYGDGDPHKLDWRYRDTEPEDTLTSTWVLDQSKGTLTQLQTENVYAAMLKVLATQHVLVRRSISSQDQYCLVGAAANSFSLFRMNALANATLSPDLPDNIDTFYVPFFFAPSGCEDDSGAKRIFLPPLMATAGKAVVLNPSGDFLPNYPAGFDGRSWPSWQAHCVGQVVDSLVTTMRCSVEPKGDSGDLAKWSIENDREAMRRRQYANGSDTVHITAVVTTQGSYYERTQ